MTDSQSQNQDPNQPVKMFTVKAESLSEVETMARSLNTDSTGVISQALALFRMVQGRKVILKDAKSGVNWEINKYEDKPALVREADER